MSLPCDKTDCQFYSEWSLKDNGSVFIGKVLKRPWDKFSNPTHYFYRCVCCHHFKQADGFVIEAKDGKCGPLEN
jgi:hypothetical protein